MKLKMWKTNLKAIRVAISLGAGARVLTVRDLSDTPSEGYIVSAPMHDGQMLLGAGGSWKMRSQMHEFVVISVLHM